LIEAEGLYYCETCEEETPFRWLWHEPKEAYEGFKQKYPDEDGDLEDYYHTYNILICVKCGEELDQNIKIDFPKVITFSQNLEDGYDIYGSFDCPHCEKGIVSIGYTYSVVFPKGILSADKVGNIRLEHYTCDRCEFKMLTNKYLLEDE